MIRISQKKIIWIIYVFYLFSIIAWGDRPAFYMYSNITFIALILSMLLYIVKRKLVIPAFTFAFLPFLLFSFTSILWSAEPGDSYTRSITLARLFLLFIIMAFYLYQSEETNAFIYGIAIAGTMVLFYIFAFYGFAGLRRMIEDGIRVGGEFVNSNTLAIFLSFSTVIFLYDYIKKRRKLSLLLAIVFILIIATTGSKKGILDLVVGIVFLAGIHAKNENRLIVFSKWIFRIGIAFVIFLILWESPVFNTVRNRMELMIGSLLGTSIRTDYSTRDRQIMIIEGIEQFKKTPLLGVGIGASSAITANMGYDTYLHNDYIEVLATGGIIGFLTLYTPIISIFIKNWKNRFESETCSLCSLLMMIYFVNGIAAVQYFSKTIYVILAISLSNCLQIKNKNKSATSMFWRQE